MNKTPEILISALRQYQHNNPDGELIPGFDYDEACKTVYSCLGHMHFMLGTLALLGLHTEPPKGLDPTFYHTGTYKGDMNIWEMIQSIKEFVDTTHSG